MLSVFRIKTPVNSKISAPKFRFPEQKFVIPIMDIVEREEKTSLNSDEDDNGDEGHGDGGNNEGEQLTHKKEDVIKEKE